MFHLFRQAFEVNCGPVVRCQLQTSVSTSTVWGKFFHFWSHIIPLYFSSVTGRCDAGTCLLCIHDFITVTENKDFWFICTGFGFHFLMFLYLRIQQG